MLIVAYGHSVGLCVSVVQNEREKISENMIEYTVLSLESSFNRSKSKKTVPTEHT